MYVIISSKRFVLIFASIFALGAVPLLISQPSGASSAGLSAGFLTQLQVVWQLLIPGAIGIFASRLSTQEMVIPPLGFILLFTIGLALGMDTQRYGGLPYFIFGAVICFGLSLMTVRSMACLSGLLIAASAGFHLGLFQQYQIPQLAEPLFFLIGNILALALIFAIAVSLGLSFRAESEMNELLNEQQTQP
jgi:hydrogenase/urease accessory protein HupE